MTIETHVLPGNGRIPNSRLPLLIYRGAFEVGPVEMEALFRTNEWPPDWHSSFGMYPRHHFHSDTHELIAVTRGTLTGRFGGHDGISATLTTGDLVVIPAGVGHFGEYPLRRISGSLEHFPLALQFMIFVWDMSASIPAWSSARAVCRSPLVTSGVRVRRTVDRAMGRSVARDQRDAISRNRRWRHRRSRREYPACSPGVVRQASRKKLGFACER